MRDFSAPHRRKVVHFGIWNDEGRDVQMGHLDAWNILCDAVKRTTTEDMRESEDVKDALKWFESHLNRPRPVKDFRKALDTVDPVQRFFGLRDALNKIKQYMGY